jgi:hypothetical protein
MFTKICAKKMGGMCAGLKARACRLSPAGGNLLAEETSR